MGCWGCVGGDEELRGAGVGGWMGGRKGEAWLVRFVFAWLGSGRQGEGDVFLHSLACTHRHILSLYLVAESHGFVVPVNLSLGRHNMGITGRLGN